MGSGEGCNPECTIHQRTATLFIPYADDEGIQWGDEGIKVVMDIPSFLKKVLPKSCLASAKDCKAGEYVFTEELKVVKEQLALSGGE